jgi:hypothetical protein
MNRARMPAVLKRSRLIDCYDCGSSVSLSARECPQCGSKEFAGASRSRLRLGYERRNDNFMVFVGLIVVALSGAYGFAQGSNLASSLLHLMINSVVGLAIAMPIVFLINVVRGSKH